MADEYINSQLSPVGIPPIAQMSRTGFVARHIGPPAGMTEEECGTVEVLVGTHADGHPMLCNYWQPTPEQLEVLNAGGFIEFVQYSHQMVMHSVSVWPATSTFTPREQS